MAYESLSLREKAAQLVFARIGSNMPPAVTVEEDAARIEALLARTPLGGLILFNGTAAATPALLARLQAKSRLPLLVASDIERGLGQQVWGGTVFPHAMAYAGLGDEAEALVEASARATAREALACGIHITFSPVADVNREARNPIIATRAFGTEPEAAARLVQAYIRGCRAEGLLTTAKHFPGHGGTHEDSHETLPVVSSTRAELERTDLVPFRAAVEGGVDLLMSAHVIYPALDPGRQPATLSRPILHGLLREELGFRGAVITDSLLMGAIRASHGGDSGAQAAALLEAGVDILLDPHDPEVVVDGLVEAVRAGRLDERRLDASVARVRALRTGFLDRFGPDFFTRPERSFPREEVGSPAHERLAREVARRAVQALSQEDDALPLDPAAAAAEGLLVLLVRPFRSRLDPPEPPLAAAVQAAFPGAAFREVGPEAGEGELQALLEEAAGVRHVVVALVVKPAAWQRFGLLPAQQRFVARLVERRPTVLVSLGVPYVLDQFPRAAARLCTYSDVALSQEALVEVLAGLVRPADALA